MSFIIGLLTVVLVFNCLLLIFLVLIQLPKKEAGAGLAFGGGATDALFGAGSGNVLTKITKWSAGILFGLSIILAMLNSHQRRAVNTIEIPKELPGMAQPSAPVVTPSAPAATPAPVPAPAAAEAPAAAPTTPTK
jgi:protein translocase SecG subunit